MLCTAALSKENGSCFHMGEKPTGRMLVLAGLLLTSLFIGMASADESDVVLETAPQSTSDQPSTTCHHISGGIAPDAVKS